MTFHPPYPTESWCVSLTQAVGRVSQYAVKLVSHVPVHGSVSVAIPHHQNQSNELDTRRAVQSRNRVKISCRSMKRVPDYSRSGCSELDEREKNERLFLRFRSNKDPGNGISPRSWSSLPTGIVTTPGESLRVVIFPPEPLMYEFVSGSKLTPGTSSLRSWASLAGLRQSVMGRKKDTIADGYTVAIPLSRYSINLVSDAHAGGFALLCTSPVLVFDRL